MGSSFRVIALIAAFNEGDIISQVIGHLVENGVDVYLIDNHSTDDTVNEATTWLGRGLLAIETFPSAPNATVGSSGVFDWTAILRRKEELSTELQADWFIHHDADEVREGPWPGLGLKEAIRWVDRLGYNSIDFRTLNFAPLDDGFKQGDDPRTYFTHYEDVAEFDRRQVKCWKAQASRISLVPSGGHDVSFEGRRVFPIPFLLRHYPIRGQTHGAKKVFAERRSRILEHEHSQGWHIQYDHIEDETHRFLRSTDELSPFDPDRVRLDILLPDNVLHDLADKVCRADADLVDLRAQCDGVARGLEEYRLHATNLEAAREESARQIVELERGLDAYRQHASALEVAREESDRRVSELEREHVALGARITDLVRDRDECVQRASDLERERAELVAQRDQLERAREALQSEILGIRASRSWRWTAPFRRLVDGRGGK